ncbi:MAG: phosphoglycerate dehydrogenase [Myxococcales bacterium]|nr:phosphoglycerate dehydrogenase [Myxococcales bacterium]
MTFRVLVADNLAAEAVACLEAHPAIELWDKAGISAEELEGCIHEVDALLVRSRTQVDASLIAKSSRLSLVGRAGIGIDNIDLDAATKSGVIVMNTPDGNATTTAEHTMALILAMTRRVPQAVASMRAQKWEKKKFMGRELRGKKLGVVGLGNIGRLVAERAQGFKMQILGYDPFYDKEKAAHLGIDLLPLDEVLAGADIITVHTPLNTETKDLINQEAIAKTKQGVMFVNCARGGIMNEQALLDGLNSGHIDAVGLDVLVEEPPTEAHPLVMHDKVICTPHLGASTVEAQYQVAMDLSQQVIDYATDKPARNALNLPRVSAKEHQNLLPYLLLAERLGAMAIQIADHQAQEIRITLHGDFKAEVVRTLSTSALVGVMARLFEHKVNHVNVQHLAHERGIHWLETCSVESSLNYAKAITVEVQSGEGSCKVVGSCFAGDEGRVVAINDIPLEATPSGHLLLIENQDQPGVIGYLGGVLGDASVNISRMQLGLDKDGGAISIVNVDQKPAASVLDTLTQKGIKRVRYIHLA